MEKKKEDVQILLVDDNQSSQMAVKKLFTSKGFKNSTTASNGLEAIQLVEKNNFDIIFIDICMPIMDGIEAIARIRKIPDKKKIPIIAISAMDTVKVLHDCKNAGANDFMGLPAHILDYVKKVQQHVEVND